MNRNWKQLLQNFAQDESGQDMIEYALVAGFIAVAAIATLGTISASIKKILLAVQAGLTSAGG